MNRFPLTGWLYGKYHREASPFTVRSYENIRKHRIIQSFPRINLDKAKEQELFMEHPKEALVSALKLPKDVMLGEVLISFVGRSCVVVENYRSIVLYTDTLVKLKARNCSVMIHGNRLRIEYYTNDEMKIVGQIKSVEFES